MVVVMPDGSVRGDTMPPVPSRELLTYRFAYPYLQAIAFFKGDYTVKIALDPDNALKSDVLPADGNLSFNYSVPEFIKKIEPDRMYIVILKKDYIEKAIKVFNKIAEGDKGTWHTAIIVPSDEAEKYGLKRAAQGLLPANK